MKKLEINAEKIVQNAITELLGDNYHNRKIVCAEYPYMGRDLAVLVGNSGNGSYCWFRSDLREIWDVNGVGTVYETVEDALFTLAKEQDNPKIYVFEDMEEYCKFFIKGKWKNK